MNIIDFINPNDLLGRALLSLVMLSFLTAPMGCFIIWRKMSYFGATLSHSALLGAIIGLATGIGVMFGVIGFTIILAMFLTILLRQQYLATDTILGMMAHFVLAIGIILISLMDDLRIDLMAYLFGDVLSISKQMFSYIVAISLGSVFIIGYFYKGFINMTINKEIAMAEGDNVNKLEMIFMFVLAITISLGMLTIGVLLIIALLIIPAATARLFANSMLSMIILSWLISLISILLGIISSYHFDLPAGASVVTVSGILFIIVNFTKKIR